MRNLLALLAILLVFGVATPSYSADVPLTLSDCEDIMNRWAADPDSVPPELVNRCRERMATAPADASADDVAPEPAEAMTAVDPCADAAAANSVNCWGPWGALAPAAGAVIPVVDFADTVDLEERPELSPIFANNLIDPEGGGDIVVCTPGLPCGFATLVNGPTGYAEPDGTEFVVLELAPDGSFFVVDTNGDGNADINSVNGMSPIFVARADGLENLIVRGADGDQRSRVAARVLRLPDGSITLAADAWSNGNVATGESESGFFVWGQSTSQADLDALNASAVQRSLSFAGPMSVDNRTNAAIRVNFGTDPNWSGSWVNPDYSFDAAGSLRGVELISNPDSFSSNVQGGFVQGALLGEQGRRGVGHIIDVTLDDVGRVKDVGLALETPL